MGECFKTTMTAQFVGEAERADVCEIMETFCDETVRLLNQRLKAAAPDPVDFGASVSYGWFQIPEEPGLYALQVVGPHDHQGVCTIADELRQAAADSGYPIAINVLRI